MRVTRKSGSPRKVYVKDVPRERDEVVLIWIKLRKTGWSPQKIASRTGEQASVIDMATRRVMNADIEESGENPQRVRNAYWRSSPESW